MLTETAENRLKRLRMRSWRRGTREMDLILGPYSDARLEGLPPGVRDSFEALLGESDPDLLNWMLGRSVPPDRHASLTADIAVFAAERLLPKT